MYFGRLEEVPGDFRKKAFAVSQAPSDADRKSIRKHGVELRQRLTGGGEANAAPIAYLIDAWPSYGATAKGTAVAIKSYVEVLTRFPTWAVSEAVHRFRTHTATVRWDAGKIPTEPLVVEQARAIVAPIEAELARITEILRAEVYQPMSDAERAKMDKAISDWTAKRRLSQGRTVKAETSDEFDARLREIGRVDGLTLSEAAR